MSATETAMQVIRWLASGSGELPKGDLQQLEELARPAPEVRAYLGNFAASAAARLTLASPPFGDDRAPGPAALWLAAAAGAAEVAQASELVRLCPPADRSWDLVMRHAVVHATLDRVMPDRLPVRFRESLRAASPLTALLLAPARGDEDVTTALAERLLEQPDGRRLLLNTFCAPTGDPQLLLWRAHALDALRLVDEHREFVLDVYEAAVALHGSRWRGDIGWAFHALGASHASEGGMPPDDQDVAGERALALALALGSFWAPLRALHRSHLAWLRRRPYLQIHVYVQGIKLAATADRLRGGDN